MSRSLDWRWPYVILAVLAVVLAAVTFAGIPADRPAGGGSVDLPGAVLIGAGTTLLRWVPWACWPEWWGRRSAVTGPTRPSDQILSPTTGTG